MLRSVEAMAGTLTADERDEVRPLVEEQVDELLALTDGADAATVERAVSLSILRLASDEVAMELADLFLDALGPRGGAGAACLAAVERLGPGGLAEGARARLAALAAEDRKRVPDGIGAVAVTDQAALRMPGATVYLLRLERAGRPEWHAAFVIVEDRTDGAVLVSASMSTADADDGIADVAAQLAREHGGTVEPVDAAGVRRVIDHAARLASALRSPVGTETAACLPIIGAALGIPAYVTCGMQTASGASPLALAEDDEDGFVVVRDDLLAAFERALVDGGAPDVAPFVAELMLDFKFAYGDGDLGRWTGEDIAGLMLDYLPHKVDIDEELSAGLVPSMLAFLDFLAAGETLTGEPLASLCDTCLELRAACLDRAADPASWGPAKLLSARMDADGVDPTDERQVAGWIDEFNARPRAERDAILGPLPAPPRSSVGHEPNKARKKAKRRSTRAARRRNR